VLQIDAARHEVGQAWPQFLPDGHHFLYLSRNATPEKSEIRAGTLDSGETRPVVAVQSKVSFVRQGYLLFAQQEILMAQAFDARKVQPVGNPFPVAEGVGRTFVGTVPLFSASQNGSLVWRSGDTQNTRIAMFTRDGRLLGRVSEPRNISIIRLSPDEKRLAASIRDPRTNNLDIWTIDVVSGIFSRITFDPGADQDAVWSPDGRELIFAAARKSLPDLYRKRVGGGAEELLFASSEQKYPHQWLRDGSVVFQTPTAKALYRLRLAGERKAELLIKSEFDIDQPAVSPDGRWIAYNSVESGRWEVYVASFPGFTERRQASTGGGCQPTWRRDGKELFYLSLTGNLMVASVQATTSDVETGVPRALFAMPLRVQPVFHQYEVTGDGRRFFVLENLDEGPPPINVMLNWNAGLKR
jgi:dipeptidyl aminopeptidase/acylaminoacyl peptidase